MTLRCADELVDMSTPKIMGILNLTPDSFFDGGAYISLEKALKHTEKMLHEGAHFIDVGAFSSRPNAQKITLDEEKKRLFPIAEALISKFPSVIFSIDTFRSQIAKQCLELGFNMVNDISGGADPNMFSTVAKYNIPYVLMHMQGNPKTMQKNPQYQDITHELMFFFSKRIKSAYDAGINDVIIDPGFGFGKSHEHNYELLRNLNFFKQLECPLLVGLSRKSMIYEVLETTPKEALNGTTALHTFCLQKGANILRVHDVKAAKECIALMQQTLTE